MASGLSKIVADVEGVEHTVISWLAKQYAAFYKEEPSIETVVDQTVSYVELGLPVVLGVTGGAALVPEIESVLDEVVSDMKVVSAVVYDFGPSPNAANILASVQSNLQGLETAGHVKDPVQVAKLGLIIKAVGSLAAIIAKAVAASSPAPAPAAA
ncbi:MAG TPA: hypothetical protein VGF88_23715 [Acidobacteriaceae bacterium]|jgi:hypothetical protein